MKVHSLIPLSLADEVLREVMDKYMVKGLYPKLKALYMTKSLIKKLYLKQPYSFSK